MTEIDHKYVHTKFPGAFKTLVAQRQRHHFEDWIVSEAMIAYTQAFSIDEVGRLWVDDNEVASSPWYWDPARGWIDDEVVIPKERER